MRQLVLPGLGQEEKDSNDPSGSNDRGHNQRRYHRLTEPSELCGGSRASSRCSLLLGGPCRRRLDQVESRDGFEGGHEQNDAACDRHRMDRHVPLLQGIRGAQGDKKHNGCCDDGASKSQTDSILRACFVGQHVEDRNRLEWPQRDEKDREHEAPVVHQILSPPTRKWFPLRQSSSKAFNAQECKPNRTDSTGFGLVCSARPVLSMPAK